MKLKEESYDKLAPWKKNYDKPRHNVKKQKHHLADKGPYSQSYSFSTSHVWMWELDHKESWAPKNWCFGTVVLEKTLESPLDCKIKPVNPKWNQSSIFIGKTDAEVDAPILWPPDMKSQLIEKTLMLGKIKAGGEVDNRRWAGWMASPTRWTWVWVSSRGRWWTGNPGLLQSTGSRVGPDRMTELRSGTFPPKKKQT